MSLSSRTRTTASDVLSGYWYVEPLRRGYKRRPHLYASGLNRSVCGRGTKPKRGLLFDYDTSMTVSEDPSTGQAQFRRPCGICEPIYAAIRQGYISEAGHLAPEDAGGELTSVFDRLVEGRIAGFVITRVIGTSAEGVARFEVDTSQSTDTGHLMRTLFMLTQTCTSVEFLNRAPTTAETLPREVTP